MKIKLEKNKNGKEEWTKKIHARNDPMARHIHSYAQSPKSTRRFLNFFCLPRSLSFCSFYFLFLLLSFTLFELHMQINAYNFIRHYVSTVMGWWILKETNSSGLLFLLFHFFVTITVVVVILLVVFCWSTHAHTNSLSEFETYSFSGVFSEYYSRTKNPSPLWHTWYCCYSLRQQRMLWVAAPVATRTPSKTKKERLLLVWLMLIDDKTVQTLKSHANHKVKE